MLVLSRVSSKWWLLVLAAWTAGFPAAAAAESAWTPLLSQPPSLTRRQTPRLLSHPRNLSTCFPSRLQINLEFSFGDYMLKYLLLGLLLGLCSLWEICTAAAAAQSRLVAATVRLRTCPIQPTPPAKWGVVVGVQVVGGEEGGGLLTGFKNQLQPDAPV